MIQITFIIPTIGRTSLKNTIQSLLSQTNPQWRAIIVFDGIPCNLDISTLDPRIQVLESEKKGKEINSAGNVRNYGIRHATTEWIGFVDDDDILSTRYVDTFLQEIINFETDVLIFRMYNKNPSHLHPDIFILPELTTGNFYVQKTGISFALKKSLFGGDENIWFQPHVEEDYQLLNQLRSLSKTIMISPFIRYFVRGCDDIIMEEFTSDIIIGNRVIIKCNKAFVSYSSTGLSSVYV